MTPSSLNWNGQTLVFLPDKALWVEQQRLLLIADVHLGKADHSAGPWHCHPQRRRAGQFAAD